MKKLAGIAFFAAAFSTIALSAPSLAATTACNLFQTFAINASNITVNSGCRIGDQNNPNSLTDVNTIGFFGGGWTSVETFALEPVANTTSGAYDIGATFFTNFDAALIVLKAGGTNTEPPNAIGYLLTAINGTTGAWYSPFLGPQGQQQNLSHAVLYAKSCVGPCPEVTPTSDDPTTPSPVPLPAPLLLLGLALGGLGAARWLKNRRAAQAA